MPLSNLGLHPLLIDGPIQPPFLNFTPTCCSPFIDNSASTAMTASEPMGPLNQANLSPFSELDQELVDYQARVLA